VFVLDFMNDVKTTQEASDYYRTAILAEETDPNKLHDLQAGLDGHQVYTAEQIDQLVTLYLEGAERERLDPILDACVAVYKEQLDEDGQVDFKGKAKAFLRAYGFLSSIEHGKRKPSAAFSIGRSQRRQGRPSSPCTWATPILRITSGRSRPDCGASSSIRTVSPTCRSAIGSATCWRPERGCSGSKKEDDVFVRNRLRT
jgi:hypothetical protein